MYGPAHHVVDHQRTSHSHRSVLGWRRYRRKLHALPRRDIVEQTGVHNLLGCMQGMQVEDRTHRRVQHSLQLVAEGSSDWKDNLLVGRRGRAAVDLECSRCHQQVEGYRAVH